MANKVEALAAELRVIPADIMANVATNLGQDGFKLNAKYLGVVWIVTGIDETEFNKQKSFTAILTSQDGEQVINVPAGIWKKARVLGSDVTIPEDKYYLKNQRVVLRNDADAVIAGSRFFHAEKKMKANEDFTLPSQVVFEYAVLRNDPEKDGKALLNPFYYDGFSKVVTALAPSFPTLEVFKGELKKSGDARIKGLPLGSEPTPLKFVKEDDIAFNAFSLIFKDIID